MRGRTLDPSKSAEKCEGERRHHQAGAADGKSACAGRRATSQLVEHGCQRRGRPIGAQVARGCGGTAGWGKRRAKRARRAVNLVLFSSTEATILTADQRPACPAGYTQPARLRQALTTGGPLSLYGAKVRAARRGSRWARSRLYVRRLGFLEELARVLLPCSGRSPHMDHVEPVAVGGGSRPASTRWLGRVAAASTGACKGAVAQQHFTGQVQPKGV